MLHRRPLFVLSIEKCFLLSFINNDVDWIDNWSLRCFSVYWAHFKALSWSLKLMKISQNLIALFSKEPKIEILLWLFLIFKNPHKGEEKTNKRNTWVADRKRQNYWWLKGFIVNLLIMKNFLFFRPYRMKFQTEWKRIRFDLHFKKISFLDWIFYFVSLFLYRTRLNGDRWSRNDFDWSFYQQLFPLYSFVSFSCGKS